VNRRGQTLVEVLIVVAIVLFMGVLSYTSLVSAAEVRQVLALNDDSSRWARVTISRFRRELQHAFLTEHVESINQYRTVFVGANEDPDKLFFSTQSHQRLYRDTRESDQTEITIWAEPSPDGRGYTLYHREAPRIDEEPDEAGTIYPIAYNVRAFNLRYLDNKTNEWSDEWDSRSSDQSERLPREVELSMVLLAPDPDDPKDTVEIPYRATVLIQQARPVSRKAWGNSQEQAVIAEDEAAR